MEEYKPIRSLYPLPFVFRYRQTATRSPAQRTIGDGHGIYEACRCSYPREGGMEVWFTDCPFPFKGFPYPEAIMMINGVKRLMVGFGRAVSADMWLIALAFFFSPRRARILDRLIDSFVGSCRMLILDCVVRPKRCTPVVRELWSIAYLLLREGLGTSEAAAKGFAEILMMMLEYDNAYRQRLQDILSATSAERLIENPRRELGRLLAIMSHRETNADNQISIPAKYRPFLAAIRLFWIFPKFRRAWRKALRSADYSKLIFDEADRYHLLLCSDYDYLGISLDKRVEAWKSYHETHPPFPKRLILKSLAV